MRARISRQRPPKDGCRAGSFHRSLDSRRSRGDSPTRSGSHVASNVCGVRGACGRCGRGRAHFSESIQSVPRVPMIPAIEATGDPDDANLGAEVFRRAVGELHRLGNTEAVHPGAGPGRLGHYHSRLAIRLVRQSQFDGVANLRLADLPVDTNEIHGRQQRLERRSEPGEDDRVGENQINVDPKYD